MIKFSKFVSLPRTPEGHIILREPIHFKNMVAESADVDAAIAHNTAKHGNHIEMSKKLSRSTGDVSERDKIWIKAHSADSSELNSKLIHGDELDSHDEKQHLAVKNNAKPSGHEFHVFSGTSEPFDHMARASHEHVLHSPAHISATHDLDVAKRFSRTDKYGSRNLVHIHVKPNDKVLHISHLSGGPHEHETVIPSGTKLKYHKTTILKASELDDDSGEHRPVRFRVHHFTIHSQE